MALTICRPRRVITRIDLRGQIVVGVERGRGAPARGRSFWIKLFGEVPSADPEVSAKHSVKEIG